MLSRKKVLLLVGDLEPGGAEHVVVSLAKSLDGATYAMSICSREGGSLEKGLEGISTILVPKQKNMSFDPVYLRALCRLILRERIDLVHSHLFGNDLYGMLAALITGRRAILTIHGEDSLKTPLRQLFYRLASRLVSRIVTVSSSLHRRLTEDVGITSRKVTLIPNGIDVTVFRRRTDVDAKKRELGLPASGPIIGCVGNIKPVKAYDVLLNAAAQVIRKAPQARFLIIGEVYQFTDYMKELGALADCHRLNGYVRFLGKREDLDELLPLMDVYVLCSRSEGRSIALLEAMASGRPIVATRVGGTPEVLEDGKTGLLVPPEDPYALAKAITLLLDDRSCAARLGEHARHAVEQYSLAGMALRYAELYGEILQC